MLSKRGLRERPSYDSLMQNIRTDFPLHLPNRDASFLRNSIQMTQFDGIGLLDNLDQQEERLVESKLRESVLKDVASGTGRDYKVMQTDPYTNTMVDKFTQAITNKSEGGSQTNRTFGNDAGTSTDKIKQSTAGSSTDRKATADSSTDPMVETTSSSSQVVPLHFDISGDPVPMQTHEVQVAEAIEEHRSKFKKKMEGTTKKVQSDLEKAHSTTDKVLKRVEKAKEKKEERKMEAEAPHHNTNASPHAKRSSSPSNPTQNKRKGKPEIPESIIDNPESTHEAKGKPGRPKASQEPSSASSSSKPPEQPQSAASSSKSPEKEPEKKENPSHSTDIDNKTAKSYWKGKGAAYIIDQLSKRNVYVSKDDLVNAWRDSKGRIVKTSEKVAKESGLTKKKNIQAEELKEMVTNLIDKGKWVIK